jgi:hypothetical protein
MIYPIRKLIEADFTVAAINAQITTLNTLYSTSVPAIASVMDGAVTVVGGQLAAAFPMIVHYVGTQPTNGEAASFGKRDVPDFPVIFAYHTRVAALASARRDSEISIEALVPLFEGLRGKAFGATLRQIVNVEDPVASIEVFETKDNAVVRVGGVLRGSLFTRTQGV